MTGRPPIRVGVGVGVGVGQAARGLALDALAVATMRLLQEAGVPSVLLKRPATASRLYAREPEVRRYCDVDLLVAPASFDRAQAVLVEHGYASLAEGYRDDDVPWHERPWRAPGAGEPTIDLHRGFAGVRNAEAGTRAAGSTASS